MNILQEMGVQRWRARGELPGAKRELCLDVCLLADASGPRLLAVNTVAEKSRVFTHFCRAVAVAYRLDSASVSSREAQSLLSVPTVLFAEDQEALSTWQGAIQMTEDKASWWQSVLMLLLQHPLN